ncbi:MAG: hypothetical protein ABIK09_05600 [Pseudomonadota bacterium]
MRVFLSLMMVLTMAACDSGNGSGVDTAPAEDTTAPEDSGGGVLPDLTGKAFRITVLESQQPTDALNPTFAQDIATYVNVLVFYIVEHNPEEGYLMMLAGPCSTEFEDPDAEVLVPTAFHYGLVTEPFRVELDGCDFEIKEAAVLKMMFKTLNKPYIVDRLFGRGTIREDLSGIEDGHLEGGILVDTAIGLCTTIPGLGVVNFHWFMNLAHICPNFDTNDDDLMDAYYFAGTFDATDVTDLFVPGEIVPIDSVVEVCEPHNDECFPID